MFLVPCLVYLLGRQGIADDLAIKMVIATAMATILFTSLSSVWVHQRRRAVRWDVVRGLAPGIVVGGSARGCGRLRRGQGSGVRNLFALFVGYSAWRMFQRRTTGHAVPLGSPWV
jgi:uncharacterized membrane protein YfcA